MKLYSWTRLTVVFLVAAGMAACGDTGAADGRGYTKAPLERPGVIVRSEQPGAMSRYGTPNRVVAEELRLPDTAPAAAPAADRGPVELPAGVTEAMVAAGQQVYSGPGACFACHGPNGTGTPLAPALNDPGFLNIDGSYDSLVQLITVGVPNPVQAAVAMPARGGAPITDEQVREVAAYVYSISR